MAQYFKTEQQLADFRADVSELLREKFTRESDGAAVVGIPETVLAQALRGTIPGLRRGRHSQVASRRTWSLPGGPVGFLAMVREAGFTLVRARNDRGNRATVVTSA